MPTPNRKRHRALELLAASPNAATEAILVANGFTIDRLVELVRAGLATATTERVVTGGRAMEIARVRIMEAAGGGRSHHNAGKDNGRSATTRTTSGLYRARGYPICHSETDPSAHRA
jgi:hypothetical protein